MPPGPVVGDVHPHPAGDPRIGLGRHGTRLLVVECRSPGIFGGSLTKRIVQVHRTAAREHEDVTDAAVRQKADNVIGYLDHAVFPPDRADSAAPAALSRSLIATPRQASRSTITHAARAISSTGLIRLVTPMRPPMKKK